MKQEMETRRISVSFIVRVAEQESQRYLLIDWIEKDGAEAIADDIKNAILNIE